MTAPKNPGPAPRAAQYRSGWESALAWTSSPSAVTTSTAEHALARPPPPTAVPPLTTLEQVAAQPHRRAVPAGEQVALRSDERAELRAAADRRADRRHAGRCDRHLAQAREVDQEGVVVQAPRHPRVPAGPHGHTPVAVARESDAGDDVGLAGCLEHGAREPGRTSPVEDRVDTGRLVVRAAPLDQTAVEHGADPTGRRRASRISTTRGGYADCVASTCDRADRSARHHARDRRPSTGLGVVPGPRRRPLRTQLSVRDVARRTSTRSTSTPRCSTSA